MTTHAEDLASKYENYIPRPEDERPVMSLIRLREARTELRDAVVEMRKGGYSWEWIGAELHLSADDAARLFRV